MTRHLVTGATGQDGRLLVELLAARGHDVIATALDPLPPTAGVPWRHLDVTDEAAVRRTLEEIRPDVVHHLAAISSVAACWAEPDRADAVNRRATLGVLDAALGVGAAFVHASTSEIFGPVAAGVADETTPLNPQNPYGEAKAAAHAAVQDARRSGAAATNLVLFGHTGPLQPGTFVIPTICRQAVAVARGERVAVELQDPSISRDWGAASDAVRAFALAAEGPADDYVIATGELHQLAEVARWALEAAGVPDLDNLVRRTGEPRPADIGGVVGNASRARTVLGWVPTTPLRTVVEQMVDLIARS